ncbi:MAG: UDP-N-acetylmuramate dehydrogenase [Lentisphaerae bacterium]|nr:UDP-N-acetylmuramate dehydrogenase [Lentisphaerota bacterium]
MNIEAVLRDLPEIKFRTNVKYFQLTTLGAGDCAPLVADVEDDCQLVTLLRYLKQQNIKLFLIGAGSNLVGSDDPFDGVIVRLRGDFTRMALDSEGRLVAGGGARLPEMVRMAASRGFSGMSKLCGIPATVGGALRMNAGANGQNISDKLTALRGYDLNGNPWSSAAGSIEWRYRSSSIPEDVIVTAAEFKLPQGSSEVENALIQSEMISRRNREPAGRTAGCIFRNPGAADPAGKLIDLAGLKGQEFGAFYISKEHGNYLVNKAGGSEKDFIAAAKAIRRTIADKFGLYLECEVKFINPAGYRELADSVSAPRIALFMGGSSSEREVSLRSGAAVANALRNGGYDVTVFDLQKLELPENLEQFDLVYPVLHGSWGEDGRLQKLLEEKNIDFIGSGSIASDMIMDKLKTKKLLKELNMPTAPDWQITAENLNEPPADMSFPVVVKVPCEGSTVGIEKIDDIDAWRSKLPKLLEQAPILLAEKFIQGRECTVPVILNQAMTVVEIRPPGGFYDYDAKYIYANGHTEYFCPPVKITAAEQQRLQELAVEFYNKFNCRDMVRVDFIIGSDDVPYILEGNSLPGFTATSLVPKAAACMNISFERLCAALVQAHCRRKNIN